MLRRKTPLKRTATKNMNARKPEPLYKCPVCGHVANDDQAGPDSHIQAVDKPRPKIRHTSKKRAKLMRVAGPWRRNYLAGQPCAYLGCIKQASELHEISSGPAREKSLMDPCALLPLCREHHREVQDWPIARQLALKLACCPWEYDRERVNVLRGRMPNAITREEVLKEARNL